jgi:hypothetical protein
VEEAHPWVEEEEVDHHPLEVVVVAVDLQYHSSLVVVEEILVDHLQSP